MYRYINLILEREINRKSEIFTSHNATTGMKNDFYFIYNSEDSIIEILENLKDRNANFITIDTYYDLCNYIGSLNAHIFTKLLYDVATYDLSYFPFDYDTIENEIIYSEIGYGLVDALLGIYQNLI